MYKQWAQHKLIQVKEKQKKVDRIKWGVSNQEHDSLLHLQHIIREE